MIGKIYYLGGQKTVDFVPLPHCWPHKSGSYQSVLLAGKCASGRLMF